MCFISIPRLELSGTQLLAKLVHYVALQMTKVDIIMNSSDIIYWTDSIIVFILDKYL